MLSPFPFVAKDTCYGVSVSLGTIAAAAGTAQYGVWVDNKCKRRIWAGDDVL